MSLNQRELFWVGSSLEDLKEQPGDVRSAVGHALHEIQCGRTPDNATSFKQGGNGVMEIKVDFGKETYRTMYVAKLKKGVYVLHSFQKKSKKGKATPLADVRKIQIRYKEALKNDKA